jgi:hypothetical protein
VKHGSRSAAVRSFTMCALATAVALLTIAALPAIARAERVVLYPLTGRADEHRIEELEERLETVIRALGHEIVAPPGGIGRGARPSTAAEMEGTATAAGAMYVLLVEIEPMRGQYRLHLRVGYQPTQRVEELVVSVLLEEEEARLRDVLAAMLRPDGLGEDAVRLTGEDPGTGGVADEEAARRAEEERARLAAEEEERLRREGEERARAEEEARRAEEERTRTEREAWNARATYGSDGEWLVMVGGHGGYAIGLGTRPEIRDGMVVGQQSTGGGLGLIQVRIGRSLPGTDGLEIRGGIDGVLGAFGGLDIVLGGCWQWTPFVLPIHIGIVAELGASFSFTGGQTAGFVLRAGAIASWTPAPHWQIEVALPELGVMTNGAGAVLLGATARVGYRF